MAFDAKSFMEQKVSAPMDTERARVAEGQYRFMIDAGEGWIEFNSGTISKGERAGQPWVSATIRCLCQDEAVKAELGRDKVVVRKQFFLDLDATGQIATGKGQNVDLGQMREALNQNDAKKPWDFSKLEGAGPFMGEVRHRPNEKNPNEPFAEIGRVAKVS